MSDVSICPIFDQSAPNVWDDFMRIRMRTMQDYGLPMSDSDIANAIQEQTNNWNNYSGNFAFGAYDGGKMIGYVQGLVHKNVASLLQLHVLPEYQHQHIGARLLSSAQSAASLMSAHRMELFSLCKSRQFYERMGYEALSWTEYRKKLSPSNGGCVPVFRCQPVLARACGICPDMAKQINKSHLPMFVSYDCRSNINGYTIADTNGGALIEIRDNNPKQIVRRTLERATQSYMLHVQNITKQR